MFFYQTCFFSNLADIWVIMFYRVVIGRTKFSSAFLALAISASGLLPFKSLHCLHLALVLSKGSALLARWHIAHLKNLASLALLASVRKIVFYATLT